MKNRQFAPGQSEPAAKWRRPPLLELKCYLKNKGYKKETKNINVLIYFLFD